MLSDDASRLLGLGLGYLPQNYPIVYIILTPCGWEFEEESFGILGLVSNSS